MNWLSPRAKRCKQFKLAVSGLQRVVSILSIIKGTSLSCSAGVLLVAADAGQPRACSALEGTPLQPQLEKVGDGMGQQRR